MLTDSTIESWLREDLGHHDVTNDVPGETEGRLVAREGGVAAGLEAAVRVFEFLGANATAAVESGEEIASGETVLRTAGPARATLRGERVAVNVAGHASGVATATRAAVDAARTVSDDVAVAATRKTTPGLRGVEKRAVAVAGGDTHRLDTSHMVMVKENHVDELGMEAAVERFRELASFATKVEVEVEDPADAARAADAGADIVLLDNMSPDAVRRGVESLPPGVLAEASGGITVESIPEYADTGVDVISMGSLTHSAPSLDYSFLME
ncbi:carboxylating nicotinate-nucleotide diphosphorylase [Halobaculum sp. WSA2]|uniref:Nicotinate-nucleotide pyrophosphorylase [carboxylating] n=1 Tax=Halobaculum saliterrae TaxID=2073113 RepID=A0A6B0SRQ3_9EURY|nr:carboxylating nicotinate-nucleotide diphosphorylase [Halobaculum saliterrae]MXR41604.1 carboxylating nicotinate-nucleotide diphosphorylase [Halobaculum saliterrae]